MKYLRLLFIFCALFAVCCSKEPAAQTEDAIERIPDAITLRAHSDWTWSRGDALSVFDNEYKRVNFSTSQDNVPSATFSSGVWTGKAPLYAVFCSKKEETTCSSKGVMGVYISSRQNVTKKASCPKNGEASVGQITGSPGSYDVKMNNISAFVSVKINSGIIAKITASAPGGEIMSGYVDVDYSKLISGEASFWTPTEGKTAGSSVSIVPSGATCFEKGEYLISILPGTYSNGIQLTAYDDQGNMLLKVNCNEGNSIDVARNAVVSAKIELDSSDDYSSVGSETVPSDPSVPFD